MNRKYAGGIMEQNSGNQQISFIINENKIVKSTNGNYRLNIEISEANLGILLQHNKIKSGNIEIHSVGLTERELYVLRLMARGMTNTEIANEIKVSSHTIKVNVANILQKLNVKARLQAVVKGISENLIDI